VRLIGWSLWALLMGGVGLLAWGPAIWLAVAGLAGLVLAAVLYLWGAATGRIDPFPLDRR
jgi:hypothetical protein